ncbi:MAG TPA: transcriptional regulator [Phycisphaerae bacterium]|nr:transcriptional regulator [Phycisphaerae bacterium]
MPKTLELAEHLLTLSKLSWAEVSKETVDLTEAGFLALDHLCHVDTATVGDLHHHVGVMPSQMSRLLRLLESSGFVRTTINPDDRRKVDVTMTEAGREAHDRYRNAKLAPLVTALQRLTAREREEFMALVQRMSGR